MCFETLLVLLGPLLLEEAFELERKLGVRLFSPLKVRQFLMIKSMSFSNSLALLYSPSLSLIVSGLEDPSASSLSCDNGGCSGPPDRREHERMAKVVIFSLLQLGENLLAELELRRDLPLLLGLVRDVLVLGRVHWPLRPVVGILGRIAPDQRHPVVIWRDCKRR